MFAILFTLISSVLATGQVVQTSMGDYTTPAAACQAIGRGLYVIPLATVSGGDDFKGTYQVLGGCYNFSRKNKRAPTPCDADRVLCGYQTIGTIPI